MRVVLIVVSTCAAYFLRSGAGLEVDGSNSTAMTSAVGASVNSSGMVGANSTANHTFRPAKVGSCQCIYYSSYEKSKVTEVFATSGPTTVQQAPKDPDNAQFYMPPRGDCWLILNTALRTKSRQDQYNLRISELAVCDMVGFAPSGCKPFCQIDLRVPLPYNNDETDDIAACIATAALTKLKGLKVNRDSTAVFGGLVKTKAGIRVKSYSDVPGHLDEKLKTAYVQAYKYAVLPKADEATYKKTKHYEKKDDPLYYDREFHGVLCDTLGCVVDYATR
mmetsp:Transcript_4886/g.10756  ORF Transcript_4886/g.10756 Transcript_4886/m.10756 type:complete len:277 (-) Transcript_4886:211-1041(-)